MKKINFEYFIGIDVSKDTLDCCLWKQGQILLYKKIDNNRKGITSWINTCKEEKVNLDNTLFCMENTGNYSELVAEYLSNKGYDVWVANAMDIKYSAGMTRGKTDKQDALMIAKYAYRNQDKYLPFEQLRSNLKQLKKLLKLRKSLIETKKQLNSSLTAIQYGVSKKTKSNNAFSKTMQGLKEDIKKLDRQIDALVSEDKNQPTTHKFLNYICSF